MSSAGKPQRPRSRRTPALRHLYLAPITARVRWKAEPATRDWWYVQFGASDGNPAHGWVCEKNHPNTSWQSPWAWPGFEIVDATDIALTDAFLRNLVVTGSADWQEEHKFKTSVDTVNNTRLLRKLDQLVSKLPPSERRTSRNDDPSNRVTARAIQEVLKTPWLAQPLTHLILRYQAYTYAMATLGDGLGFPDANGQSQEMPDGYERRKL